MIQQGAKLVQEVADILPELGPPPAAAAASQPEDALLAALGWAPSSLDQLQQRLAWPLDRLLAGLLEHELGGRLRQLPGGPLRALAKPVTSQPGKT